jgi:hypothetical protein
MVVVYTPAPTAEQPVGGMHVDRFIGEVEWVSDRDRGNNPHRGSGEDHDGQPPARAHTHIHRTHGRELRVSIHQ